MVVNAECDDANVFSGDGCSSSCTLEPGFDCNLDVAPTKCKSKSMLFYKIEKITKQELTGPSEYWNGFGLFVCERL